MVLWRICHSRLLRCGGETPNPDLFPIVTGQGRNTNFPIDMIVDVEGEGVTIWKTILSVLRGVGANGFEGVG